MAQESDWLYFALLRLPLVNVGINYSFRNYEQKWVKTMDSQIDELKEKIEKGNALIIVGAGVSIGATEGNPLAGWTGLLKDGVDRCVELNLSIADDWPERPKAVIDSKDVDEIIAIAGVISKKLGAPEGGDFKHWLKKSVGLLKATNPEIIEAIKNLNIPIATTNYDGLLEEVTNLKPLTWMDGSKAIQVLQGEEEGIFHIHGYWDKPESVILGTSSYEKILGDGLSQTILKSIAIMKTVIFIGCGDGLDDPNFGELLKWIGKTLSGSENRNYLLALRKDVDELQKKHPPDQRLSVIPYGEKHADLAPFIKSLVPNKLVANQSPSPADHTACRTAKIPSAPYCFGRDEQLKDLISTLLSDKPEPTPILGPPGIGKSTLVSTALRDSRIVERYGDCRFFIRCDGITTRNSLAAEIARALGIEITPDAEPYCLYTLRSLPSSILVLDNFETPWEADQSGIESFLAALADVPGSALIITMRLSDRPEGVRWRETLKIDRLELKASREVFLAIAGKEFEKDSLLDTLCNVMGGVPLAINLMAHVAEGEPNLKGIWKRWEKERTSMLKYGAADDRLTNIEISYKLSINGPRMVSYAQRLLSILAYLPDGLAHCDIEAVLPNKSAQAASVLRKVGLAFDESDRLRLLAPLREYVRKHHGHDKKNKDRLMYHYVHLIKIYSNRIGLEGGEEAVTRLSPEAYNIEFLAPIILTDWSSTDTIKAFIQWGEYCRLSGIGSTRPLEAALKAAKLLKEIGLVAKCTFSIGGIEYSRSNFAAALSLFEKALPLFKESGAILSEADCLLFIGNIAFYRSEFNEARIQYEQALELYKIKGSILGEAKCMVQIALIELYYSEYNIADSHLAKAMTIFKSKGDIQGEANCIYSIGEIAFEHSDFDLSRSCFEQALLLNKRSGIDSGAVCCVAFLGAISTEKSEFDMANTRFYDALIILEKSGDTRGLAFSKRHLANLNVKMKKYGLAFQNYEEALQFYDRADDGYGKAHCAMGFGDIASAEKDNEKAQRHYDEALALFEKIPNPYNIGHVHRRMARIAANDEKRKFHVQTAHDVWEKVELPILVSELKTEFPGDFE